MSGAIHPFPQYAFMAWCLVKHRDNFTFYLHLNSRIPPTPPYAFRIWCLFNHRDNFILTLTPLFDKRYTVRLIGFVAAVAVTVEDKLQSLWLLTSEMMLLSCSY
jgi:hypothetical protein